MQKKNLVIVFLLIIVAGVFVYPKVFGSTAAAVQISDVSANPSKYLGKLTMAGVAGTIYPEDGVFVLADVKGCCQIPIMVPFTEEQKLALEMKTLFAGQLPSQGDPIEATGTLKKESTYYMFDVEKVTRNGQVIISRK